VEVACAFRRQHRRAAHPLAALVDRLEGGSPLRLTALRDTPNGGIPILRVQRRPDRRHLRTGLDDGPHTAQEFVNAAGIGIRQRGLVLQHLGLQLLLSLNHEHRGTDDGNQDRPDDQRQDLCPDTPDQHGTSS
jgi:hypothetical protein